MNTNEISTTRQSGSHTQECLQTLCSPQTFIFLQNSRRYENCSSLCMCGACTHVWISIWGQRRAMGTLFLFRLACLLKEGLSLTSRVRLAVRNCSNPPVSNSSVILCGSRRFGLLSSKLTRILRWLSSPWFFTDYSNFKNATRMWCSK